MKIPSLLTFGCLLLTIPTEARNLKEDPLPAPFALQWGQGPDDAIKWARKNQLVIKWIEVPNKPETTLEIDRGTPQTLPGVEFNKIRLNFTQGQLVEATVIYLKENTITNVQSFQDQIQTGLEKTWGEGSQEAEAKRGTDTSQTITWKVEEGRYILFNTTHSEPDNTGKIVWIGKISYRHHALSLLIQAKNQ